MSGYGGNPDLESEHALILSENGIHASQQMLVGKVLEYCSDCGERIVDARRQYALKAKIKCEYCVQCQSDHDKSPHIRMLDRIL